MFLSKSYVRKRLRYSGYPDPRRRIYNRMPSKYSPPAEES